MKNLFFSSLALLLTFASCNKNNDETQVLQSQELTPKEKSYVQVSNSFAFDMFQTFKSEVTTKNVFISPLSIQFALAMTYNGAETSTKTAFEETLRMAGLSRSEINDFFNKMNTNLLAADAKVNFSIANSIWYNQNLTVLDSFINVNKLKYNAEVTKADFMDKASLSKINAWVTTKTNGKIPTIIDEIPNDAAMYLINALYFNGTWKYAFDKSKTNDFPFTLNDKSQINCKMMQQQENVNYTSNETVQMVELPYENGNFNMYVLLPQATITTVKLIENLSATNWKTWKSALKTENVLVKLPRFKFSWGREINPEIKSMGLAIAFGKNADFSSISTTYKLQISKVIHKTYIDVNEEGTEAAAVTAVEISYTLAPENQTIQPIKFIVDKPFVFVIQEKTTGSILFIGKVNNPTLE